MTDNLPPLTAIFRDAMDWGRSYGLRLNNTPEMLDDVASQFAEKARASIDAALAARGSVPAGWVAAQAGAYIAICEMLEATGFGLLSRNPNADQLAATVDTIRELLTAAPQQVAQPRDPEDGAAHAAWTSHATNWKEKFTTLDHQNTFFAGWIACRTALASYPPVAQAKPEQAAQLTQAAIDVLAERQRQISAEGWTPEHDDEHDKGVMAAAAACYALHTEPIGNVRDYLKFWPWDASWWKPGDRRRNLVKAGALILAEIERLDRAAAPQKPKD